MISKVMQYMQFAQMVGAMMPRAMPEYEAPPLENTDPMDGMATLDELSEGYQYDNTRFYLGNIHADHGTNFKAGVGGDRHIFLVAGNAGGKGRSIIIPNLLRWRGGSVNLDLKGELASITAMRRGTAQKAKGTGTSVRKFMGNEVAGLDPFGQIEGASRCYRVKYNPLTDIDISAMGMQAHIKKIASACVVPYEGNNEWISKDATIILGGIIEAFLHVEKNKSNHTLVYIYDAIKDKFQDLLDNLLTHEDVPPRGLASSARGLIDQALENDSNEIAFYKSCLIENLIWLTEPEMQKHLGSSDVSIKNIVQSGGDVYISVPPNRVDDLKGWLRLIIQTCINAKVELGVYQETVPTLFCMDEFALLGKFKEIEKNAGFIRGYNCKMLCVIQNVGQIKSIYDKNWETFLGNAEAIIGFATNDLETEEYLANRTGKITGIETSTSIGSTVNSQGMQGGGGHSKTVNQAHKERQVRRHNDIHQQCARKTMRALVIPADGKPFFIHRQNYDDLRVQGLFDSLDQIQKLQREDRRYFK